MLEKTRSFVIIASFHYATTMAENKQQQHQHHKTTGNSKNLTEKNTR